MTVIADYNLFTPNPYTMTDRNNPDQIRKDLDFIEEIKVSLSRGEATYAYDMLNDWSAKLETLLGESKEPPLET